VIERLAQDEERLAQSFDPVIRGALADGQLDFEIIRAHLVQLRENATRFRGILTPGFISKYSNVIVGGITGAALGAIGINSNFLISKAAQFTASKWADWKGKLDEEFGDKFYAALDELPIVCENMDAAVRRSLTEALDRCLRQKLQHLQATLEALSDFSSAGLNVEPAIVSFRVSHEITQVTAKAKGLRFGRPQNGQREGNETPQGVPVAAPHWIGYIYALLLMMLIVGAFVFLRDGSSTSLDSGISPEHSTVDQPVPMVTPHPAREAVAEAIRLYPALSQKDSALNREFVTLYEESKAKDPALLSKPDWPLTLAARAAATVSLNNSVPKSAHRKSQP
jgi:hypothetical protein